MKSSWSIYINKDEPRGYLKGKLKSTEIYDKLAMSKPCTNDMKMSKL